MVGASTCFSQEAQRAANIVLFPRPGEAWVGGEKSSPEVSSSLGVYLLPVVTNAVVLPYNVQCSIQRQADKNSIFGSIAEADTSQRARCPGMETALGQPCCPRGT